MIHVLLWAEFRADSATADPALVKERSIAQRRRVSSRPTFIGDRPSTADHILPGFRTRTHVVLTMFALMYV